MLTPSTLSVPEVSVFEAHAQNRADDLAFDPEGSPITGISKHFLDEASPFLQEVLDGKGSFVEEQVA